MHVFVGETREQYYRRMGYMTKQQMFSVGLFTVLWIALVASVVGPWLLLLFTSLRFGKQK